ncbi:hypothetical protein JW911_02115 [Candidatus Peregrinibacteria bacterium]|nr:hypothetical protein [Candidatus Peregrinibacteria bacterium]
METPKENLELEQMEEQMQVETIECTDYYEYRRVIARLQKAGYEYMYNVENDLVKQHLDHFRQISRYKAVTFVTAFKDPDSTQDDFIIDNTNTAIWYKA